MIEGVEEFCSESNISCIPVLCQPDALFQGQIKVCLTRSVYYPCPAVSESSSGAVGPYDGGRGKAGGVEVMIQVGLGRASIYQIAIDACFTKLSPIAGDSKNVCGIRISDG